MFACCRLMKVSLVITVLLKTVINELLIEFGFPTIVCKITGLHNYKGFTVLRK